MIDAPVITEAAACTARGIVQPMAVRLTFARPIVAGCPDLPVGLVPTIPTGTGGAFRDVRAADVALDRWDTTPLVRLEIHDGEAADAPV